LERRCWEEVVGVGADVSCRMGSCSVVVGVQYRCRLYQSLSPASPTCPALPHPSADMQSLRHTECDEFTRLSLWLPCLLSHGLRKPTDRPDSPTQTANVQSLGPKPTQEPSAESPHSLWFQGQTLQYMHAPLSPSKPSWYSPLKPRKVSNPGFYSVPSR
jgi:hypothetical protein